MLSKVKEGKAIRSSLENIPGSAEEDKQQIAEVDAIRLEVLKAIQDVLDSWSIYQRVSCVESMITILFVASLYFLFVAKEPIWK